MIGLLALLTPLKPLDITANFVGQWRTCRLRRGDISLQPPLTEIDYRMGPMDIVAALIPSPVLFAMAEAMNPGRQENLSFRYVQRARAPLLSSLAIELYDEAGQGAPSSDFYAESLISAFLGQIVKGYARDQNLALASNGTLAQDGRVRRALTFIDEHLSEEIALSAIARHAGSSPAHLAELFKEATGDTIWRYVQRQRLNWAKKLLRTTNHSVAQISEQVGYSSAPHLSVAFKAAFGMTPGKFRRASQS